MLYCHVEGWGEWDIGNRRFGLDVDFRYHVGKGGLVGLDVYMMVLDIWDWRCFR